MQYIYMKQQIILQGIAIAITNKVAKRKPDERKLMTNMSFTGS